MTEFGILFREHRNAWAKDHAKVQTKVQTKDQINDQGWITLQDIRKREAQQISNEFYAPLRRTLAKLQYECRLENAGFHVDKESAVCITGDFAGDFEKNGAPDPQMLVRELLQGLIPWRKGPFRILGTDIDAEWDSRKKWKWIDELYPVEYLCKDKRILDIGANNMYYSFLMLDQGAREVLAIDPLERYGLYYEMFMSLLQPQFPPLFFETMGIEELFFHDAFDTAFLMGILYHQRDPLAALARLHAVLRKDGIAVVETICLPGQDHACLCPFPRYLKSKGYWFIPTIPTLCAWLEKSNFSILSVGEARTTTSEEQRAGSWTRGESLADFLNPQDQSKTVEGYPAPQRTVVIARKK